AAIAATSSKLEKIRLLAEYLQRLDEDNLAHVAIWFTGLPFAASEHKVLQLGWALLGDALCATGGIKKPDLHQIYLKHSDLGESAFELLQSRPARSPALMLEDVDFLFQQIAAARGPGAKMPLLLH